LVIFTNPLQSFTLHNFGQSLRPASPHFDDQARLLSSPMKLKPTYFHADELAEHVVSSRTLEVR
jgi:acyl-homoserine lactone acylase PvdQ